VLAQLDPAVYSAPVNTPAPPISADPLFMAYISRFGAQGEQTAAVAVRLASLIPANLPESEQLTLLDRKICHWAETIFGRKLRVAQVQAAFMHSQTTVSLLLADKNAPELIAALPTLNAALPLATPAEIYTPMPEQSLAAIPFFAIMHRVLRKATFRPITA
jgi:hypothetical protein